MAQMLCRYCGKECKKRNATVYGREAVDKIKVGEPCPRSTHKTWQQYDSGTGKIVLAIRRKRWEDDDNYVHAEVWVGDYKYWGSEDAPFCRQKCAEFFAVAAVRAGYEIKRKA